MNCGMTLLRSVMLALAFSGAAAAIWSMRYPEPGGAPPRMEYDLKLRYVMNLPRVFDPAEKKPAPKETPLAEIPPRFRALIIKAAAKHALAPELIAAVIARESNFDPKALAPDGGRGLMQLMPEVCRERKCRDPFDPAANIAAGTAHLAGLRDFFKTVPDPAERILFALAAYNGGAGHVIDARTIARRFKLDPDRWSGNVEEAIQFLKFRSFHKHSRHGYCNADVVVNYVRSIQGLAERFKSPSPLNNREVPAAAL